MTAPNSMPPVAEVTPHSGRMLLLDRILAHDDTSLTSEVTIRADHPFVRSGRVGAWMGLEYMAQSIAALAGCQARARGEPPKIGFLIGGRAFACNLPYLPVGSTLRITVRSQWQDESGLGLFNGELRGEGITADGTLSVFQPADVQQFLQSGPG